MDTTGLANYAILDENNFVIDVFRGREENADGIDWEEYYSNETGKTVKRYSFNTLGGVHANEKNPFRMNAAMIDGTYDPNLDAFIQPKPISNPSFILDPSTLTWSTPFPKPTDGKTYVWSETELQWLEVEQAISIVGNTGFFDFKTRVDSDPV